LPVLQGTVPDYKTGVFCCHFSQVCVAILQLNRVITRWNLLDQGAVDATSVNAFKGRLEKLRDTRMGFFMD